MREDNLGDRDVVLHFLLPFNVRKPVTVRRVPLHRSYSKGETASASYP
jgi:hypothetical protein